MAGLETGSAEVRANHDRDAAIAAGGVFAIDSLWSLLHPPPRPVQETEPEYIDPALR